MADETINNEVQSGATTQGALGNSAPTTFTPEGNGPVRPASERTSRGPGGRPRTGGRAGGRRDSRPARVKPEFEQKIIQIRRVTRVIAGGKRFNFSVAMVIGNRNGSVGVGIGKGADTSLAIEKAFRHAKKHMIKLKLTDSKSLSHEVMAKYSSARLHLKPSPGRGLIAGSALRDVLILAGVADVNAKILSSSKNKLNIARGAIKALSELKQ